MLLLLARGADCTVIYNYTVGGSVMPSLHRKVEMRLPIPVPPKPSTELPKKIPIGFSESKQKEMPSTFRPSSK
jgi:hypothetical protein